MDKKNIAEGIYASLVERRLQNAVDIARKYIAVGGDLLGLLDSIFENKIKDFSDVKIFYFFVAFCLSLGKDDYSNNVISRFHINLFLRCAPEFLEINRNNLLSVKNVNFYRRLFMSAVRGLGVLNYENEDISGEKYLINNLLSGTTRPVVFDVGANVGEYSSSVKRAAPDAQVYAFEPNPATFVRLKERARHERFFAFNIGLSDKEEKRVLFDRAEYPEGSGHASLYQSVIEEIHKVESSSTDVLLTTLDMFLQKIQFDSTIDLLKIDTEGHELAVLKGAAKTLADGRINAIQFEYNEMNVVSRVFLRDFFSILPEYDFFRLLPDGFLPLERGKAPLEQELFAFQNIVAVRRDPGYRRQGAKAMPDHAGTHDAQHVALSKPPIVMPKNLIKSYTQNFTIPCISWYFDDTIKENNVHITQHRYEQTLKQIADGTFSYYGQTVNYMKAAFEKYPLQGKKILIYGLADCNCDAIALYYNAAEIFIVDYNKPICEHPRITVLSMEELDKMDLDADIAISISSFEHDGLGRYGDPLDPDGDLNAMRRAKTHLKKDGLLFLAVPIGSDCIVWNAHRIYGPMRFPLLCTNWTCIDSFGYKKEFLTSTLGSYEQPVFVFKNTFAEAIKSSSVKSSLDIEDDRFIKHKNLLYEYAMMRDYQANALKEKYYSISWNDDHELGKKIAHLLQLVKPKNVEKHIKLRMGGANDGGYVMLDPGNKGIAYSFGISTYAPWDDAMVTRGFTVFQYDGTIDTPPQKHEQIIFSKYNVTGSAEPAPGTKNLSQIITENGHANEDDIILQIDIEGDEWDFFETVTTEQLLKFKQIIVEFHDILSVKNIHRYTEILEKILQTHEVVHFHYNNNGRVMIFDNFCVSSLWEISFARKNDYIFTECNKIYPTELDAPCVSGVDDVYIGYFDFFNIYD